MTGKLVSLFDHPEFVRRVQARDQRELAERVLPVTRLGRGSFRCRRCSLEFVAEPGLIDSDYLPAPEPCPQCDLPIEFDAVEAFLEAVLQNPTPE